MLSEDSSDYDYLVVTAKSNTGTRIQTVVIDVGSFDFSSYLTVRIENTYFVLNFYLNEESNPKKCTYSLLSITQDIISSVHIQSIVGIKCIDPDIKNVTSLDETLLYSGNDHITATTGSTAYTLSDDIINFDYILVTIYGINSDTTQSVNVLAKVPVAYNYGFDYNTQGHASYINSYGGWFALSNNQIEFAVRYRGENVSSVVLSSVVGIKLNTLTTSDIAEMAMPSNVYINIPATTEYIAPANGLIYCEARQDSTNWHVIDLEYYDNSNVKLRRERIQTTTNSSNSWITISKLVAKGQKVDISSGGVFDFTSKFFYSVGDAKALGLI